MHADTFYCTGSVYLLHLIIYILRCKWHHLQFIFKYFFLIFINKTYFLQFFTKKKKIEKEIPLQIVTANSLLINSNSTKFLVLMIDSMLTWEEHIMGLSHKLNKACFAIKAMKTLLTWKSWKMVYYSYFHSVMSYGIIFWGTSPYSNNILRIQKRIIRIIMNSLKRESCRQLYKQQQILTVYGQYIYSLLMFVVKSREVFFSKL